MSYVPAVQAGSSKIQPDDVAARIAERYAAKLAADAERDARLAAIIVAAMSGETH